MVYDVINRVDAFISEIREAKSFVERFILWPRRWQEFASQYGAVAFNWTRCRLDLADVDKVPDSPGIYTILIEPGIAGHPHCSFLAYVGKAEDQTLRERFRQYLGPEQNPKGRPHIIYLLREYSQYLVFCCTTVPAGMTEDQAEKALQTGFIPPYCRALPAEVRRIVGAFQ